MSLPVVSVIVPAYNVSEYIVETIESLLAQTYQPIEIVVVNDGSDDGTAEVIAPYADRIVYIEQANRGLAGARNTGLRIATGSYIALLDGDDTWLPDRLERCVELLESRPEIGFVTSDAWLIIDGKPSVETFYGRGVPKKHLFTGDQLRAISERNFFWVSVVARRAMYDEVGPFDEQLRRSEDYDQWMRFILAGHRAALIDEPLGFYRMRRDSLSADTDAMASSHLTVLDKHHDRLVEQGCYGAPRNAWMLARSHAANGHRRRAFHYVWAATAGADAGLVTKSKTIISGLRMLIRPPERDQTVPIGGAPLVSRG